MSGKLLTVDEVAEFLSCSVSFVYGLMASGRLKHHVLGRGQGGKRISTAQLDAYLHSTEKGGELMDDEDEKLEFIR